jgi:GNAT superfamily N-acetyltransferase
MNQTAAVEIRAARAADVPVILALINELAEFENLQHQVVATEATLRDALFGSHPGAEAVIARVADEAAAFALYFHNFSTFVGKRGLYLEDLYVRPAFRGHGIGRQLLSHLAQIAVQRGCGRFEWSVLDWNRSARNFYEALGAEANPAWVNYRVSGAALERLAQSSAIAGVTKIAGPDNSG